jgi:aminoglycoside/choline kinase family phosphotransferase
MSVPDGLQSDNVADRIDRYLRRSGLADRSPTVVPLAGDASDRRYFRVICADGHTAILAVHTDRIELATLPFANVAGLLASMPVPVPSILGHSDADGILALQDLGDVTLQVRLTEATTTEREALYREAIELIAELQRRGDALASPAHLPYQLAFDVDKLTFELDFFVSHFLEAHRGAALSTAERTALSEEWAAIAGELAAERRVLCHRDYHSRNLMLHDGRLHLIDFQDARLGPDTYDLASLLRDSYVDISDSELEEGLTHFLAATSGGDAAEFRRRFDLMALQRNLKALGTFGFQTVARAKAGYVQYVPRTLRYARANLLKYPRFGRLHGLLAAHIPELG